MERLSQVSCQLTQRTSSAENSSSHDAGVIPSLKFIEIEIRGAIGIVCLNSPKTLNCLTEELMQELGAALMFLKDFERIKVIILASRIQKAFCSGADLRGLKKQTEMTHNARSIFKYIEGVYSIVSQPIIGCANSIALGGGLEILLMCDMIVASEDAQFALPEINVGVIPGIGGSQRLTRAIGRHNANYYMMTGERFSASKALEMGIVQKVTKKGESFQGAMEIAEKLASKPSTSLIYIKKCSKAAEENGILSGCGVESEIFARSLDQKAKHEGIDSLLAKKSPDFSSF